MSKLDRFHGRVVEADQRTCDWLGCNDIGRFKAPVARDQRAPHNIFCLEHVREYNLRWDYFNGLEGDEIERLKAARYYWDRPTWPLGENATANMNDPHGLFEDKGTMGRPEKAGPLNRPLGQRDRKALETLGLGPSTSAGQIKSSYKKLVKKYHPDTNLGEADAPKLLQRVIEAYNQLSSGLKNR